MNVEDKLFDSSTFFFQNYLKGKDILPIIRRIFDPLLTIVISSYLFERFYFKYKWIDISDYKSILDFLFKGHFIIPVSIFIIVYLIIGSICSLLFNTVNDYVTKFTKKLVSSKEENIILYSRYKKISNQKEFEKMLRMMHKEKDEVEKLFYFTFKIIFVTIFYFCIQSDLGVIMFTLMLILELGALILIWIVYTLFDAVPFIFKKIKQAGELDLQEKQDSSQTS